MKVFITGGSGFVGSEIISELLAAGREVIALVHQGGKAGARGIPGSVQTAVGDVLAPDLEERLAGSDAVIHLVGVIREFPGRGITLQRLHVEASLNVLRAMKAAGVSRLVHMSALGAGPDAATEYFRTKWEAESAVKSSGLDWTVFKPSVIFGPSDQFVNQLADMVRRLPVVPVIGDGEYLLQPVSVKNVARGFGLALDRREAVGQTYEVGGPERFSYNQLLDAVARGLGKDKARKLHFPLALMKPLIRALERFERFPVTRGQLEMLLMNNVCDPEPFFRAFSLEPLPFEPGIAQYLAP